MRAFIFAVVGVVATFSIPTFADQVEFQSTPLSTAGEFITPFNTSLGTLDSVNVTIDGVISGSVITAPDFDSNGDPVPSIYLSEVTMTLGAAGEPFLTSLPATFLVTGPASGAGEPEPYVFSFDYSFTLNAATDLTGFAPLSESIAGAGELGDPGPVSGTLSSFESVLPQLFETNFLTGTPLAGATAALPPDIEGSLIVQYNYTPATVPTPEPGTFSMLFSGLLGLGVFVGVKRCQRNTLATEA